jgi:hypothetical protein
MGAAEDGRAPTEERPLSWREAYARRSEVPRQDT